MAHDGRSRWVHARAPGLDPWREYDACGVGFVARASGERSSEVMRLALQALGRVAHRGAAATDNSGDGAGVLTQIPARLFGRDRAGVGDLDAQVVEAAALTWVFQQDQLERGLGDREVGVARPELGGLGAEQLRIEGDGLIDVVDVEGELQTAGHGNLPGVRH